MRVYSGFSVHPKHPLNLSIPSNSDSLAYSNLDTPQHNDRLSYQNYYNRLESKHTVLQFSRSRDKKSKRATTQPEEEISIIKNSKVEKSFKQIEGEKKTFLEFDKTKFRRIKNKIQDVGIRRENSKEFLLGFVVNKEPPKALKWNYQKNTASSKERRNRNMTFCVEPRPKTFVHRPQASAGGAPVLSFTDRPKRSVSKSQHKSQTDKQSFKKKQNIFNELCKPSSKIQRKISYLKTQPQQPTVAVNAIEAQFQQFLKNEQNSLHSSRLKKQKVINIPFLQFGKPCKSKPQQPSPETKKYQYSSFYDKQVNERNNQMKANTSRQAVIKFKQPLNSFRSNKQFPQSTLSSLNSSRRNLKY